MLYGIITFEKKSTMRIFTFLILSMLAFGTFAQLSIEGTPKSFKSFGMHSVVPFVDLQKPDMAVVNAQDAAAENAGKAYRNGILLETGINPETSGVWDYLPDGSAIWRVGVKSDDAIALGLYFSNWYMTPGIEVYAYTPDKSFVIGAFTELNNIDLRTMATQEIPGDEAILEVFIPDRNQKFDLVLNQVAYFYRGLTVVRNEKSGACEVNVICSEGDNWRDQIRGVAKITMILSDGTYMCSGSLVNNIAQNCTPYFLTADHCSVSQAGVAVTPTLLSQWTFRFNYQATTCSGNYSGASQLYTGATYKASDTYGETSSGSDFFLCQLNNTPTSAANPYYNGWSYLASSPTSGVSVHHPDGNIKKISTYSTTLSNYGTTHWAVSWVATTNGHGVTEGGSSGSPIFNQNKLIVGTLTGGTSACDNLAGYDIYGKMSKHWTGVGTTSDKNVKYWLDPNNLSGGTLAGRNYCVAGLDDVAYIRANIHLYPNPATDYLSIDFSDYNVENGTIVVTDMLGKTVTAPVNGDFTGSESIDVRELEPGMYFLMIQSQGTNVSLPFVVE